MNQICMWCGGDASEPDHLEHCDGRQGRIEAEEPILRARGSDPDTSHEAMAAFDRATMSRAADLVVRLHVEYGPMADYELKARFAEAYQARCCAHLYQQARSTARDRGQLRDSGERKRNPATNRNQVIWEACADEPPALQRCGACGHLLRRRTLARAS